VGLLDDHLAFMLAHQGQLTGRGAMIWRGRAVQMTVDEDTALKADLAAAGFQVDQTDIVLRGQRSALPPGAVRGDAPTLDGATVQVRQILPQNDGLEVLVLVAAP
jgi:hypothetical protein